MELKLLQREKFKKQQKQLVILISKKIADKITKVSKTSPQNTLETVESEIKNNELITEKYQKYICIPPEQRHKIIDDLRLI